MEDVPLPDLRDIELKLGRKVPESLVRSLRGEEVASLEKDRDPCGGSGGACSSGSSCCSFPPSVSSSSSSSPTSSSPRPSHSSSALERLQTKLHLLRQEMVSVARQLWEPAYRRGLGVQSWVRGKCRVKGARLVADHCQPVLTVHAWTLPGLLVQVCLESKSLRISFLPSGQPASFLGSGQPKRFAVSAPIWGLLCRHSHFRFQREASSVLCT